MPQRGSFGEARRGWEGKREEGPPGIAASLRAHGHFQRITSNAQEPEIEATSQRPGLVDLPRNVPLLQSI